MRRENNAGEFKSEPTQLEIKSFIDDLRVRTGITGTEEGIRKQYSNVFNPMVNEGFFADKVVIVEGDSELYSLPIYAKLLSFDLDRSNISIVHSNGKGPMDRLLRIFNGFKIPTYLWFDGDKNNDDCEIKNKTIELLNLCGHAISEISNLETIVSDRFAVIEEDYEKILMQEIPNYHELLQAARQTLGPIGKPLKHKFIALRLKEAVEQGAPVENTIPPFIVDIVRRIHECAVGECVLRS